MNDEIMRKVLCFRQRRNWERFHNPKDLAISLSIEASELLENFQWKTSEEALDSKKENIADELADVLIYSILLADSLDLRIGDVILNKLDKNERKYPIEKAFNRKDKYTDL